MRVIPAALLLAGATITGDRTWLVTPVPSPWSVLPR